jgi:hypothetical protein
VEAERFGGLEVDHELVFGRRLHRQFGHLLALEDAIDVARLRSPHTAPPAYVGPVPRSPCAGRLLVIEGDDVAQMRFVCLRPFPQIRGLQPNAEPFALTELIRGRTSGKRYLRISELGKNATKTQSGATIRPRTASDAFACSGCR